MAKGTALVTGASRGIGLALALELADRGFEVVAGVRDPARCGALDRPGLRVVRLDVTKPGSIEIPRDLRVLVNNAGIEGPWLPVESAPLTLWREIFETNLFGLVETTRSALPELRKADRAVVCNITSSALFVPMPFLAPYRASKAAVSALGESLRTELMPLGIRVIEVVPGAIATDMLEGVKKPLEAEAVAGYEAMARRAHEDRVRAAVGATTARRAATHIADAIEGDDASLRHACDAMGEGLLAAHRSGDDESRMNSLAEHFAASPSPSEDPRSR